MGSRIEFAPFGNRLLLSRTTTITQLAANPWNASLWPSSLRLDAWKPLSSEVTRSFPADTLASGDSLYGAGQGSTLFLLIDLVLLMLVERDRSVGFRTLGGGNRIQVCWPLVTLGIGIHAPWEHETSSENRHPMTGAAQHLSSSVHKSWYWSHVVASTCFGVSEAHRSLGLTR